MKSHLTIIILILLLTCILSAGAIPTFTIVGNVTDAENQPASDGLIVIVENLSRSLSKQAETGAHTQSGSYVVAFVAEDDNPIAQAGDTLNLTVKNSEGNTLAQKSYQISEDDIKQAKADVPLQLKSTSGGENGGKTSPVFVVGGEVTDDKGNLVTDALDVTVTNETLSLTKETQLGQNTKAGSYVVTFIATDKDTEFVVQTGDTLKVTLKDAAGSVLAQKSQPVSDDEIANTRAIVNLQITGAVKPGPAATMELVATPDTRLADGSSKAILKATIKDSKGLLVRDETVTMKITAGGGGKISAVTNNNDGTYTAEYTAGTAVETVIISATTANNVSATVEITLKKVPTVDPIRSTIVATSPTSADGSAASTITVTLLSSADEPISGKRVVIKVSGAGNTVAPAEAVTDNKGVATFKVRSTVAETKEATATDATDNITLSKKAEMLFQPGPVKYVTVKTNLSALSADGKSQATITITVEDANRNPIPDAQVNMTLTGSGSIPPSAVHQEGGTHEAIYTAGEISGEEEEVIITATVNSVPGETTITLTKKPPVSLTLEPASGSVGTAVTATGTGFEPNVSVGKLTVNDVPVSVIALGTTVVVGDENIRTDNEGTFAVRFKVPTGRGGNVLVAVGDAEAIFEITARIISVSPKSGVAGTNITLQGDGFAREDVLIDFGEIEAITRVTALDDGSFEAIFEANVQASGLKKIKATGELSQRSATVDFELLKSNAKTVEIVVAANEMAVGGSTTTLTITVKDDGERPVIEEYLTITPQLGTVTTATHQGDGVYTATYTSGTKAGKVKILATASNDIKGETELTLVPGPAAAVTVEANPSVLPGDGEADSQIMATVKDAHGNLVVDEEVTMTVGDAGGTLKNDAGETGTNVMASNSGDGTYIATYISAEIEVEQATATVTARTQNNMEGNAEIILSRNPDFSLDAEETTKSAQPGEPLIYFIEVTGQNGFNLPVELETKGLPEGVEAAFSPDEVTPTAEKPEVDSQLELEIPETIEQGEYTFSIRGINFDTEKIHRLNLTFTIEKVGSNLSVLVRPKEVPLGEKIKVSGEVILQEGDERTSLEIELTYQFSDAEATKKIARTEGTKGEFFDEFTPDKIGSWKVKVSWEGDSKYQGSAREVEFQVIAGISAITLTSSNESPKLGDEVVISGELIPRLEGEPISLKIERPDGVAADIEDIKTEGAGSFQYKTLLDQKDDWTFKAIWEGNENYDASTSEKLTLNVIKELGKAIIVLGGGNESTNDAWDTFDGVANRVYTAFLRRQLTDDDIYFLSPSLKPDERVDVSTSELELERVITHWAHKRVNAYVPLYIYFLSHNLGENFLLEKKGDQQVFLTPQKLDEWLDKLAEKTGTQVFLIFEACHSGKFITAEENGEPILPRWDEQQRRIIIASAHEDEQARLLRNLSSFSRYFFEQIERNVNVREAFVETEERLEKIPHHSSQSPRLEANGNADSNTPGDYAEVAEIYIPDFIKSLPAIPEISQISPKQMLQEGETSANIFVKVLGADITGVYGTVIPPDFDARKTIGSWDELAFDDLEFLDEGDGKYTTSYDKFIRSGEYHIIVYAENPDGASDPVQTTVLVKGPWDVNEDNSVDIADLVLVGSNFGKEGENIEGDVNGDGRVDIADLILVGRHFGEGVSEKGNRR